MEEHSIFADLEANLSRGYLVIYHQITFSLTFVSIVLLADIWQMEG
jgi:hypothetical protein